MATIVSITSQAELAKHCQDHPVVLVDFWAPWCGPCKAMNPVLDQTATTMGNALSIVKVNIDDAQDLAGFYEISSIPSLLLFINGKHASTVVGSQTLPALQSWIERTQTSLITQG